MTHVFLSSTSRDLADYRQAAIEVCNRLGLVPVAMEHFEAAPMGAVESSARKLAVADLYVGIYAHRYGTILQGEHASVTEIEFDLAESRGLDRLCFVADPDHPWPPELIDFAQRGRLEAFLERVRSTLTVETFTTVDDFRAKLLSSLVAWERSQAEGAARPAQAPPPLPTAVPGRPALLVGRKAALEELKARLGASSRSTQRRLTVVRGWPGVGKTTLVTAVSHDPDVLSAFPDGILWAGLGEQGSAVTALAAWSHQLGSPPLGTPSLEQVVSMVRGLLQDRRMLLVADDIWEPEQALPLKQAVGPGCHLLVTTRGTGVARAVSDVPGEDIYRLDVLDDTGGIELLDRLAPTLSRGYPQEIQELVMDLEGLPLALRVAGRLLEAESFLGLDPRPLLAELRQSQRLMSETAPDDRFDLRTGMTPTIQLLFRRSTDALEPPLRERFAMLGVFAPKPATFDRDAMAAVWQDPDPLPAIRVLVDRGLLEPLFSIGRFQMHAVLALHARSLLEG